VQRALAQFALAAHSPASAIVEEAGVLQLRNPKPVFMLLEA